MAKWSHSVLAGFDRALHGIRTNPATPTARRRVARPAPELVHEYELGPAIGFAAIGTREGARFELRRRPRGGGIEEQLDLDHRDVAALIWTIKVANAKSPGRGRILDPGIQTLGGRNRRVELARPDGAPMPAVLRTGEGIRSLGVATTDAKGNLVVFAGEGRRVDEFDDDCDGWVRAELLLRSGTRIVPSRITSAWFVATTEFIAPDSRIDPDEIAPGGLTKKAIRP